MSSRRPRPTWVLMLRNVSESLTIKDAPAVFACMIVDLETELVLAARTGSSEHKALASACRTALQDSIGAVGRMPSGRPSTIICDRSLVDTLRRELAGTSDLQPLPPVQGADDIDVYEDIFDSMIATLNGRELAPEPVSPETWRKLYALLGDFVERELWRRWSDQDGVLVEIDDPTGESSRLVAIVRGGAGIEFGMQLYPETAFEDEWPGLESPEDVPSGAMLLFLGGRNELPQDVVEKAARYGWPARLVPVPAIVRVEDGRPGELGAADAVAFVTALVGVLEVDRRLCQMTARREAAAGIVGDDGDEIEDPGDGLSALDRLAVSGVVTFDRGEVAFRAEPYALDIDDDGD